MREGLADARDVRELVGEGFAFSIACHERERHAEREQPVRNLETGLDRPEFTSSTANSGGRSSISSSAATTLLAVRISRAPTRRSASSASSAMMKLSSTRRTSPGTMQILRCDPDRRIGLGCGFVHASHEVARNQEARVHAGQLVVDLRLALEIVGNGSLDHRAAEAPSAWGPAPAGRRARASR